MIVVATTLLDPLETPADDLRALCRDRRLAELHLRGLKTQLGMELLRGQSADVVTKEILMHLVAYNLIRLLMWQAAREHGRDLHRLSFTGTLHRRRDFLPLLLRPLPGGKDSDRRHAPGESGGSGGRRKWFGGLPVRVSIPLAAALRPFGAGLSRRRLGLVLHFVVAA